MKNWWNGLPTELQTVLAVTFLGAACFFNSVWSPVLAQNLGALLLFLGGVCTGILGHGLYCRGKGGDAMKDLLGDQPKQGGV